MALEACETEDRREHAIMGVVCLVAAVIAFVFAWRSESLFRQIGFGVIGAILSTGLLIRIRRWRRPHVWSSSWSDEGIRWCNGAREDELPIERLHYIFWATHGGAVIQLQEIDGTRHFIPGRALPPTVDLRRFIESELLPLKNIRFFVDGKEVKAAEGIDRG